jgi:anhydro-N-acetylmuramic acid kinase
MKMMRAIGLMSGTSMDGIDVAFLETDGEQAIRLGATGFYPYDADDRALLRAALVDASAIADRDARPGVLAAAEAMVTARHAAAASDFLAREGLTAAGIDLFGFHGQTVAHRPAQRLTAQIGDGRALAARLGRPVAYDFRAADVAAGGQGAPLVPAFHRALVAAAGVEGPVAVVNIGGVANLTSLAPGADPIAFDTGPGNALLDDLMLTRTGAPFDADGATAAAGRVDAAALARLMAHPYFAQTPPKSLDRNAFSAAPIAALSTVDAAATLTAFTAAAIAAGLAHLPARPECLIVCGGGARNATLMRMLAQRTGLAVKPAEALGWSSDAMEAQAFAYLAVRHVRNLPITFPSTTGIDRPLAGGVLALPPG